MSVGCFASVGKEIKKTSAYCGWHFELGMKQENSVKILELVQSFTGLLDGHTRKFINAGIDEKALESTDST